MKKKVDPRIRTLIENGVKTGHRNLLILVGDKGKDTVVSLHYILSKCRVKARPSVLWCYKKDLGFTTHRKKREKIIKKQIRKGLRDADSEDPFELFIASTDIRYTYYKDSHKILGNTFGMCILQDFEALTPNLLARTVETVEGGGLIVFLLDKMSSLKQLYTKAMDVHSHFRTESNKEIQPRFNERFLLSLTNCENCLIMDDEMNVLPITTHIQNIQPVAEPEKEGDDPELKQIKQSVQDTEPLATIIKHAKTLDQAKALLTFVGAISEKTLRSTVALTAARGRGKSAALGLAIATSVAFGYSNIFVTSPSPENLNTLFDFVFKGLDALEYKEHTDYEIVQSTNPNFNKAIVRVNIFRNHRQTIQYIQPQDYEKLGQTELLVIDEAAAIPLPIVKNLLGPYLVFMSSTINGYEGTGRSLSLKLISQLREQSVSGTSGRILHEVELKDPVRYARGDPVEKWLNNLLCLDASVVQKIPSGFPHPSECELYYVNRDTLFSYHKASEAFLQRLVALFVSSHYKNSPNDLMLMSDAPAHHIFVLLGPVDDKQKTLPEILCAVQVSLEGQISKEGFQKSLESGKAPDGDLIPWTISQQFQDKDFASLSGGRVVRIAAHPDYQKMGYGSRTLDLLSQYFQGDIMSVDDDSGNGKPEKTEEEESNELKPRKNLPPLLLQLKDRKPERLHYLGVSFGVTHSLYQFWKKGGYRPVYLRQSQNELTGEYTCIMLKNLKIEDLEIICSPDWLDAFNKDFKKRFLTLLGYSFKTLTTQLALSIINPKRSSANEANVEPVITRKELEHRFSPFDLKRLESYSRNLVHHHVILDMLPAVSQMFFTEEIPVNLSAVQCAVLIGLGLQHRSIEEVSAELTIHPDQCMALFNKSIRKFVQHFRGIQEKSMEKQLPGSSKEAAKKLQPLDQSLNDELAEGGSKVEEEMKKEAILKDSKKSVLDSALKGLDKNKLPSSISVPSQKKRKERESSDGGSKPSENGKQKKKKNVSKGE